MTDAKKSDDVLLNAIIPTREKIRSRGILGNWTISGKAH